MLQKPILTFIFLVLFISAKAQNLEHFIFKDYIKRGNHNPVIPGYFADPSLVKMDGKYFIYATTVSKYMEPVVWISENLTDWEVQHLGITGKHLFWAPTMLKGKDGKYYLYYSSGYDFHCHLMIGETPTGPWEDFGKVEEGFDMQIFEDPVDGKVYGISSDPKSRPRLVLFDSNPRSATYLTKVEKEASPEGPFFDYREGSMIFYRDGLYYMLYSGGGCSNDNYKVRYSYSKNIWGPYEDGGIVLNKFPEGGIFGPGHNSVFNIGNDYFIVYHRADLYSRPSCDKRQVCINQLAFDNDGMLKEIKPDNDGIDFIAEYDLQKSDLVNLALDGDATAPENKVGFDPVYAIDGNYATRWEGAKWFSVDLKEVKEIEAIQPRFTHYDYYNLYQILYSNDNVNWKVYADHTKEAMKASAPVNQSTIKVRYVKIDFKSGPGAASLFELEILGPK